MNIITLTQRTIAARLFAVITVISMLMSAFPVAFSVAEAATSSSVTVSVLAEPASAPEYFEISYTDSTTGDVDLNLDGWQVKDEADTTYTFSGVMLEDSNSYRVCQNSGSQVGCDASWNGSPVWNNTGDTLTLLDDNGETILELTFGDVAVDEVVSDSVELTVLSKNSDKLDLCHATASEQNPYNAQSPNISSFFTPQGHSQDTEDIIPPFYYENGDGLEYFPGNNWDSEGQEIYRNDCVDPNQVVDICPNIDGDQIELPKGHHVDNVGDCVKEELKPVLGCTDPEADNYNPKATEDNHDADACEYPEPERCENLLTNGSFEEEEVTNASLWQKFASVAGWLVEKVSDDSSTTLEHHRSWNDNEAAHQDQYVELDGDEPTRVSQSVPTIPGATYELKWAFAPRQNTAAEENELSVQVEGTEVATNGPLAGIGTLSQGDWQYDSYSFAATGASTDITFEDLGPESKSGPDVGTFLDDAQLCLVREPDPEPCEPERNVFADNVEDVDQGLTKGGAAVAGNRSNPGDATGDPDWSAGGSTGFYSLGFEGWIVVSFDKYVVNVDGDDLSVHEATNGSYPLEKASVEVSQNGTDWELLSEEARNDNNEGGDGVTLLDFDEAGLAWVKYVRITDTTDSTPHNNNADGFDLDTVDATSVVCDEPEPEPVPYKCDAGLLFMDTETDDPDTMSLYTVDETDGSSAFWADFDINLFPVLAVASDETIYSIDEDSGELVTLDDDSGAHTVVGDTGIKSQKPVAMEFAPDGTLYALTEKNDALYSINTGNGAATKLHDLDLDVAGGDVVFEGSDIVYVRNQGQIYGMDDSSYAETLLGTLNVGSKRITSAATKDGIHYAYTRQDSFHPFNLNPFVEDTALLQTGPFAWGDGSYCPAEEQVPEGKIKVFKWVNDQSPKDVPFEEFSFQIDDMDPIDFNQWGWEYDYVPVGETYEITEADILQGYEHVVTVCKTIEKPEFNFKKADALFASEETEVVPLEFEMYKNNEPKQVWPGNTVTLEDEDDLGICLIVNKRDYDVPPAMCSLDIVSNAGTVVVENNAFATLAYTHDAWTADIGDDSDAEWVWENYSVLDPEATTTLTFKETFEVTGGHNALLEVAADNSYKAWLNGTLVIDESEEGNNFNNLTQDDEDVSSYLVDGTNTLLIEVTNHSDDGANYMQNPAGVMYRLTLDGDVESCGVTTDIEPEQPVDVCENIDEVQEEVPEGYYEEGGACYPEEQTDSCEDKAALNYSEEGACEYEEDDDSSRSYTSGTRVGGRGAIPQVLGESTTNFCPFLEDYMQMGWENDPFEVMKLQAFLNKFVAPNPVTGFFGATTDANVKAFQEQYRDEVLDPWYVRGIVPHEQPTGFVYKTTLWKINSIICPDYAVLPDFEGEDLTKNVDLDAPPVSD